jgi:hypothetical protein
LCVGSKDILLFLGALAILVAGAVLYGGSAGGPACGEKFTTSTHPLIDVDDTYSITNQLSAGERFRNITYQTSWGFDHSTVLFFLDDLGRDVVIEVYEKGVPYAEMTDMYNAGGMDASYSKLKDAHVSDVTTTIHASLIIEGIDFCYRCVMPGVPLSEQQGLPESFLSFLQAVEG